MRGIFEHVLFCFCVFFAEMVGFGIWDLGLGMGTWDRHDVDARVEHTVQSRPHSALADKYSHHCGYP